ncbi:MAG: AAA family ATPase, partial [Actinomycetota bacterium]|nr:AAA family ATPase [Actinomycetota bacterium]
MSAWVPPALPAWWARSSGPAFVGRREEFDELEEIWAAAEMGRRQVVFVGGEPGAGKSRLVSEAASALSRAGAAVLVGHCLSDSPVAYQPFRDPVRSLIPAVDSVVTAESREVVRDRLTALVGIDRHDQGSVERAGQARDLYDAVVETLEGVAAVQPVALVLEDLHWATRSTLQMLAYLVHHLTDSRVLIVGTHRPTAPDRSEAVVSTITDLYRDPGVHRLDLVGLNTADVTEFIRMEARLPSDRAKPLASRLHDETGGNPFLLQEICRDLGSDVGWLAGSGSPRVPGTIRDAYASRLGQLDESSRDIVELAAVLGERVPVPLLLGAAPLDEEAGLACLERAVEGGLLGSVPGGLDYRFAHALARQAVLDVIPPLRRSRHHARAGEALEARQLPGLTGTQQLAYHFSHALGDEMSVKARHYLVQAGVLTERALAHEEAAQYFQQAAEMADDPVERHEVLLLAVPCLVSAGRFTTAMELSRQVATETADPTARLEAATAHERAGRRFGEASSAALLTDALHDYGADHDDPAYVRALASLGRAIGFVGMIDDSVDLSSSTLARAREMGDDELLAHVLDAGLWHGLHPERARITLVRAQELSDLAKRLRDYDTLGSSGFFRATLGYMLGDRKEIDLAAADMRWAAERSGLPYYEFWVATVSYGMRFIRGDFAGAERDADQVRRISSGWEGDDTEGLFGVQMFMVRRETGRLEDVRPFITGEEDPDTHWAPGLLALYTALEMAEPAAALLTSLMDGITDDLRHSAMWPAVLGFLVEAALFVQDEPALRRLRPLLQQYHGMNLASGQFVAMLGSADRYLACVDSFLGEGDPLSLFDAAQALDTRSDSRVHLATSLAARARHLAATGRPADRAEARAAAERARALAEPVGHRRVVAIVDGVIAALDQRAPDLAGPSAGASGRASEGDSGLTSRELDVLALLVGGASNQRISEQLVISPHTAANHVRSIMIKTG